MGDHALGRYGTGGRLRHASSLKPMTLDRFKTSAILPILTPVQAITHFKAV